MPIKTTEELGVPITTGGATSSTWSLLGQLGRLRLDEGDEVLVDEEHEAEAGDLQQGVEGEGTAPGSPSGPPRFPRTHLHH